MKKSELRQIIREELLKEDKMFQLNRKLVPLLKQYIKEVVKFTNDLDERGQIEEMEKFVNELQTVLFKLERGAF